MNISGEGHNLAAYQEATERDAGKMPGVICIRFWCVECKASKPIPGRESRGWKKGFRCAECAKGASVLGASS